MSSSPVRCQFSAARLTASIFGVLSGLGGLLHGVGEILQGNVAPSGVVIDSWVQGPIATNMGGEPGMTIVPNLLITGILTVAVSMATIVWSIGFVQRKWGGRVLILLAGAMLLVGGGFGPPILGILAGVAGLGVARRNAGWWARCRPGTRRFLARLWPWVFGVCVANGVFLVVGSVILVFAFDVNNPDLFTNSFFFAVLTLLLSIVTGTARDVAASFAEDHA